MRQVCTRPWKVESYSASAALAALTMKHSDTSRPTTGKRLLQRWPRYTARRSTWLMRCWLSIPTGTSAHRRAMRSSTPGNKKNQSASRQHLNELEAGAPAVNSPAATAPRSTAAAGTVAGSPVAVTRRSPVRICHCRSSHVRVSPVDVTVSYMPGVPATIARAGTRDHLVRAPSVGPDQAVPVDGEPHHHPTG